MSSPMTAVSAARSIIYLGMDVHRDSLTIAVLPADAKAPTRLDRLPNDLPKLTKWLDRVARDGELRACYEASGAGYVLHRALKEWGHACEVIAPSLIPKRAGVRRKIQFFPRCLASGAWGRRLRCPPTNQPIAHILSPLGEHEGMDLQRCGDCLHHMPGCSLSRTAVSLNSSLYLRTARGPDRGIADTP